LYPQDQSLRLLGAVAILNAARHQPLRGLAGFVCAVHYGLGLNGREVPAGECLRLVAFLVMIGAGYLYPGGRNEPDAKQSIKRDSAEVDEDL
jgi:hypothetical protein